MPYRPKQICGYPGCSSLSIDNSIYCLLHQTKRDYKKENLSRQSSNQRGYDYKWQKFRQNYLRLNPLCQCNDCINSKYQKAANVIHHINGFTNEIEKYDLNNLMPMNKSCHDALTAREQNATRRYKTNI